MKGTLSPRSPARRTACGLALLAALATGCSEPGAPEPAPSDGSGVARVSPSDPVRAGSVGTWTFAYRAEGGGVATGGAVSFRVPPWWDWSPPQLARPGEAGHVSLAVGAERASVRAARGARLGELVFRVEEGRLAPGEGLLVTYEDARADSYAEARQEFVFAVDADGDGRFRELAEQPSLAIEPRPPVAAWVVAPALAAPGEEVRARATLLDELDNRVRTEEVTGTAPRVRFRDEATGLAGASSLVWPAESGAPLRLYWGDLHGHSAWSDGTGEPEDYFRYARDVSALDFAALTDHDDEGLRPLDADRFAQEREIAESFHAPGRFVTLYGYEYTNPRTGHLTVLSPSPLLPVLSHADAATDEPEELWAALRALGLPVLTIPHHVGGSTAATDWSHFDPEFERVVEICSVHGNSECAGCPREVPEGRPGSFVRDALADGHRLSFIASGDSHNGHPGRRTRPFTGGLVGLWAPELTREAVWEALRDGRTFATTGARLVPELWHDGGGRFRLRVRGAAPLAGVVLVKNGREVWTRDAAGESVELAWSDPEPPRPGDSYYLRVTQRNGEMAWTSPIYFD